MNMVVTSYNFVMSWTTFKSSNNFFFIDYYKNFIDQKKK